MQSIQSRAGTERCGLSIQYCDAAALSAHARRLGPNQQTGWSVIATDPVAAPNGGVQVVFANGDMCGTNPRQVTFQVICKPGFAPSPITYTLVTSPTNTCWYTLTTSHQAGCAGSAGGGGGGGGLSGGTVFLIILIVLIPVYVIAGCIVKRVRSGAQGIEACPNIDFWKELPGYIRDGFRFTWTKLRGCCGKGDGAYTEVK